MPQIITSPDKQLFPPRFCWLKRLAGAMILFGCLLVGLRYWALAKAQREFAQLIESIHQGGDPVYAQDFAIAISAGEGGEKLLEAARGFAISKQVVPAWDRLPRSAFSKSEMTMIDAVLAANHQQLKLVREARRQPVDFPAYDVTWGTAHGAPMLSEFSHLADALSKAGHRSHQNADDGEAVEYLQDQLNVERLLEHYPYQAAHMIAESISDQVSQDATSAAFHLKIKFDAQEEAAASEEQVRGLIAGLLDEDRGPCSGWRWRWVGARFMDVNAMAIIERQTRGAQLCAGGGVVEPAGDAMG